MIYPMLSELEATSRFGTPKPGTPTWYWYEYDFDTKKRTGSLGSLRATTEMEALDRIREAFPEIKAIKWMGKRDYDQRLYSGNV